jgi:hypothetical protein
VDLLVGADKVVSAHRGLAGGEQVRCELLVVVYNHTLRTKVKTESKSLHRAVISS